MTDSTPESRAREFAYSRNSFRDPACAEMGFISGWHAHASEPCTDCAKLREQVAAAETLRIAAARLYDALCPLGLFGQGGTPDQWSLIWRCWHALEGARTPSPEQEKK